MLLTSVSSSLLGSRIKCRDLDEGCVVFSNKTPRCPLLGFKCPFVVYCVTTATEAVASRESATCSISLLFTWSFLAATSTTEIALKISNQLVYSRFGTCISYFSHQCQPDTNQNHLGKRNFI